MTDIERERRQTALMEHNREVEIDGNSNPIQISRLALDIGGTFTHTHTHTHHHVLSFFLLQSIKSKKVLILLCRISNQVGVFLEKFWG